METKFGIFLNRIGANKSKLAKAAGITSDRMNAICNEETAYLYGEEFYLIVKETGQDLNQVAEEIFGDRRTVNLLKSKKDLSSFGLYISKYINKQKDFADILNINPSRFNKLIKDKNNGPFAHEIYDIAKGLAEDVKEVFEKIYKNEAL